MYLKSLEVHGFKSFANKLVFEFHDGITAIVGPNGSGKSNVADAVRWVLGEQSAKQLRGAKMEDVIFAGTQMRKPLGFAYVAITINNEDHKLDVPYEEVKIARRVYRSGESEYLLNGASCRLKDVQELLFDTGIGKEGYSIIGQGQIDKILSGKPDERRELFDEAAGIVKYKKRKAAAEKNLEEEKQNLVRIEDVLAELGRQAGPLERQAEKAREYLKYRDELKNLDVNMFLMEYDRTGKEIAEADKKIEIAEGDMEKAEASLEESRQQYKELEEGLNNLNSSIEEDTENLSAQKFQYNNYENNIKVLNEQINTIYQNEQHFKHQIQNFNERKTAFENELEDYNSQSVSNMEELGKLETSKKENEAKLKEVLEKIKEGGQEIQKCRENLMEAFNENSGIKSEENRLKTLLEQNNIKKAEFTQRVIKNKSDAAVFNGIMEKGQAVLNDVSEKIAAKKALSEEFAQTAAKLNGDSKKLESEYRKVQQQFHIENSRLDSLKNMAERYEGFGQSIRRVMEQKKKHSGIIGVVADILHVEKEFETAVETALGGSIQNIVTDNAQTAKDMIQYLKKNKYGRATFLPLTNIRPGQNMLPGDIMGQKGVIGIAASLVHADAQFSGLVKYLLGRHIVVDNIDNAIALADKYNHTIRIVTKEGDLLNPGGTMSGGAFKNNNNLLGRRREMEDLEETTKGLKDNLVKISASLKDIEIKRAEVSEKEAGNEKAIQELILQQNTAKINYNRALSDFKANEEKLAHIHLEAKETELKNTELKNALDAVNLKLSGNNEKSRLYEDKISALNTQLEEWRNEESRISQANSNLMAGIASLEGRRSFIAENISRITQEIKEMENGISEAILNSSNTSRLVEDKKQEIEEVLKNIEDIKLGIEGLTEGLERKKAKRMEMSVKNKECLKRREELAELAAELDKECFRLNNQRDKLNDRINSYTEYMWEQYELTYHGAKALETSNTLSPLDMKNRIEELKGMIKSLGDVNVNAVEQYNELMERYELLTGQHADLTEAAEILAGVIEELDTEMRRQFEMQFAEISSRFNNVFKELFGGGRGTIELVEGEDILLAGINIIAQPPGKKLQNMMQLSGGEKALSAIALLFAIQSLKPSPFCLLDEIEAALDDSNVGRYAQYLHKLTKDTQFIVITHRRGTMDAADILYGITMQEKGVSTLVSVNLLEEKE
ncbi:MAG: chromosome segregation protein SMC [Lachnospiraceae bacterium]|nr:chromosome segregation protein SMC [Lachnospiraceae bacterium]